MASETTPAAGWTQIKVYSATPQSIFQGAISMDFDPAVFGDIASVAVFSAAGDAIGYANVQGQHVDAHFSAISGSIGQLPDIPIFTVRIAVLPGVAAGTKRSLTLDATGADWTGPQNSVYSVTVVPGEFSIGGTLFVKGVTPGGGLLPSGTVVRIEGAGFDAGTTLSADGIAMSPLRVFGSQAMEFTLAGSTELTGVQFHLRNSAGKEIDFFPALPSVPDGTPPLGTNPHVMIPLRTHTAAALGMAMSIGRQFVGLLNQTTEPVDIRVLTTNGNTPTSSSVITIPAGALQYEEVQGDLFETTWFVSSVPIRMIQFAKSLNTLQSFVAEPPLETSQPTIRVSTPPSITWNWQIGTAAPIPQSVPISTPGSSGGFTASVSGGDWLTITPQQATTSNVLTATANPQSLGPGTYTATITVTPIVPDSLAGFTAQPSVTAVTLNVSDQQLLYATFGSTSFSLLGGHLTPPLRGTITTNGNPALFTVTASTTSGGPWLSVTPSSATTPAELTFSADPTGLAPGNYAGTLAIVGAGNTLTVPVSFRIFPTTLPIQFNGLPPAFIREAGAPEPQSGATQSIGVGPATGNVTVAYQTDTGGDWLHTQLFVNAGMAIVTVSVTPSGLAAGTYHGAVTVISSVNGSGRVPVTLTVVAKPVSPPTVTPTSISITTSAGVMSDLQTLTAHSSSEPDLVNITVAGAGALSLSPASPNTIGLTPETVNITGTRRLPGAYFGSIVVSNSAGSVTVPTSLFVTASPAVPPVLGAVVNGASMRRGPLAPGEIIAVFGSGIGPAPASLALDSDGKVSTSLGGTQLLINGLPAPLIYASVGQLTAVVPYEAGTSGTATIQTVSNGLKSDIWEVSLAPSAPGILTLDATGVGRAAALNEGYSVNEPSNPVPRGTIVQIYATGEGELSPPGVTGGITADGDLKKPVLDVSVTIGGVNAPVQFAGAAPELIAGVLAVNALVPQEVPPGPEVPISISIGGVASQRAVTIAVK